MRSAFYALIFLVLTSCSVWGSDMLLKCKDIQFFKTREVKSETIYNLEISGLAMHSSLAVGNIETTVHDDYMIILVHLVPARKGLRGDFSYNVDVPKTINLVCLGSPDCPIWKRGVGPVKIAP